jgi:hypothetical protein
MCPNPRERQSSSGRFGSLSSISACAKAGAGASSEIAGHWKRPRQWYVRSCSYIARIGSCRIQPSTAPRGPCLTSSPRSLPRRSRRSARLVGCGCSSSCWTASVASSNSPRRHDCRRARPRTTCASCAPLRLVRVRRAGRHAHYALHDQHIADLLAAARHHHEHLYPPAPVDLPAPRARSRA